MIDSTTWPQRIVDLLLIKQNIAELDRDGLWEYRFPAVGATNARLESVEARLKESLDPSYRAFLAHADGWPAFHQTVDLFGSEDLLGGPRFTQAAATLRYVEDDVLREGRLRRADLLPIAASPVDRDLFVLTKRASKQPGVVVWLAGSEIDRFSTFDEFFLAMVQYNRLELRYFADRARAP